MKKVFVCYFLKYDEKIGCDTKSKHMATIEALASDPSCTILPHTVVQVDPAELNNKGYYHPIIRKPFH